MKLAFLTLTVVQATNLENCEIYFDGCTNCLVEERNNGTCGVRRLCKTTDLAKCVEWKPQDQQIATPGCASWYDGCNTCKVNEDRSLGGCTKMACTFPNEPYCLDG